MDMEYYKKLATPPADALKKIGGGRLSGMTDIKPQWRIEKLTEVFGLCGFGWKYEITKQWTEEGTEGQKLAFCNVNLYVMIDGEWSDAIPGTGGNMLIAKEKAGLYSSDEAYKMALTDALSVAMKAIGMAADIYRGAGVDSKYARPESTTEKHAQKTTYTVHDAGYPRETLKPKDDKSAIMGDVINMIKNSGLDEQAMAGLRKKYAEVKTLEQAEAFKAEVEKILMVKSAMLDGFDDDQIPFDMPEKEIPLL
jgi:hypothetical protein